MLENQLDSPGMNLKPWQRLKHLGSDSGLQGYLNQEAPMCLWLMRGKLVSTTNLTEGLGGDPGLRSQT